MSIALAILQSYLARSPTWNVIQGTEEADGTLPDGPPFMGSAGNDIVSLYGANDSFKDTGPSIDIVFAGAGDDRIWSGGGDDLVYGGAGNDDIHTEAGNDWVFGEEGDDSINGWQGHDRLFGGNGNDYLVGDNGPTPFDDDPLANIKGGRDIINGEAGQDFIAGTAGADRLTGGADGDTFLFNPVYDNIVPTNRTTGGDADTITDFSVVAAGGTFDPLLHDRLMVTLEIYFQYIGFLPVTFKNEAQPNLSDAYEGFVFDTTTHELWLDQESTAYRIATLNDEVSELAILDSHLMGIAFYGLA